MQTPNHAVAQYFSRMAAALTGLETLASAGSGRQSLPGEEFAAGVMAPYLRRLKSSFAAWESRIGFMEQFRISRAESGFPVFQTVLELENDRAAARDRLTTIPDAAALKREMADFILTRRAFPAALQSRLAERIYLERLMDGQFFQPVVLPETLHVTVNPENRRPSYFVCWAAYDGTATLPMVYTARIEDSSENVGRLLVTPDGRLDPDVAIPLPVGGLLNPELAVPFDKFVGANSGYSLTPATIATSLDRDFPTLHPKRLTRFVLGPFYASGITENNTLINDILARVRREENAWLMTWTVQDLVSARERPESRGFFSSSPAQQEFHIDTGDLEAARMGVSAYAKHALVPHEAYQALYASGEADTIFAGFKVHVISGDNVISEV
ncbi:hypothetical protein [Gellertiella hungarica]|uniref:Uncharacterized protein n=1 Tax=Gellertiella hungarica TaxID=1572859 RepID=A0A7W6J216_9HYPH|nr:hypothetical protein [Gellertiella hungarica]MBB4063344.1 hypothetical protein [Gellertiella hungarica]